MYKVLAYFVVFIFGMMGLTTGFSLVSQPSNVLVYAGLVVILFTVVSVYESVKGINKL